VKNGGDAQLSQKNTHSYPSPSLSLSSLSVSVCAPLLLHNRDYCREQILARRPALLLLEDDKERNLVCEGVSFFKGIQI